MKDIRTNIAISFLSLAAMTFGSGCSEQRPATAAASIDSSDSIGKAGDMSFYVREVEGSTFLIAERHTAVSMVEHIPSAEITDGQHSFSAETCGKAGDHTLYKITVDGELYLLAERYNACELMPLSTEQ